MASGFVRLESYGRYIRVGHTAGAASGTNEFGVVVKLYNCQYTDRDNPGKTTNDSAASTVTFDAAIFNVA